MPKKYVVKLRSEERAELEAVVSKGKTAAWKRQRAQALLKCDQGPAGPGWIDERIAEAFGCTTRCLEKWRKQAVERGPLSLLERKARVSPAVAPKLDGEKQARLVTLACSQPPQGRSRWSLRLLAGRLVEMRVVDTISHETVRQGLKKKWLETMAPNDVVHSSRTRRSFRRPDGAGA
jgi:hypothetical protein